MSTEFNKQLFIDYITSKLLKVTYKKGSISRIDIINSLSQFTDSVSAYLIARYPNKTRSDISKSLNRHLGTTLLDKPRNVPINIYLLYLYGYKQCAITNNIYPLDVFFNNSNSWNGLGNISRVGSAFYSRIYRKAVKQATPAWLSDSQITYIINLYDQASKENLEVDHIIPLNGDGVCGLNVPWNLQLLTPEENRKKSNVYKS